MQHHNVQHRTIKCQFSMKQLIIQLTLIAIGLQFSCNKSVKQMRGGAAKDPSASENAVKWAKSDSLAVDQQYRLLSSEEFANTSFSLLGIKSEWYYSPTDISTGFSNGANSQLNEAIFLGLMQEVDRLASLFVRDRLLQEFACFQLENDACLNTFLEIFGEKAFRRPLKDEEKEALVEFYKTKSNILQNSTGAKEMLIARIMLSPQFLYRTEIGRPVPGKDASFLTDAEIASLVSYSLTGDMPDDLLRGDIKSGNINPDSIRGHVRRLLKTEKSQKWLVGFFKQWLHLTDLDQMASNPADFPKLSNAELGRSLNMEFEQFVIKNVIEKNASIQQLFLEPTVFVNQHTAPLYGKNAGSPAFERIELDSNVRKGILQLASVMSVHSSSGETFRDNPVARGALIYDEILCGEPLDASGVDTLAASQTAMQTHGDFSQMTVRQQFEAMMEQSSSCQSCHAKFMPFGFALGNFDALGTYQTMQSGKEINSRVSEVNFDGQNTSINNASELASLLANSQTVQKCFSTKVSRFITGNNEVSSVASQIAKKWMELKYEIPALFEEVLTSPEIYYRKVIK